MFSKYELLALDSEVLEADLSHKPKLALVSQRTPVARMRCRKSWCAASNPATGLMQSVSKTMRERSALPQFSTMCSVVARTQWLLAWPAITRVLLWRNWASKAVFKFERR